MPTQQKHSSAVNIISSSTKDGEIVIKLELTINLVTNSETPVQKTQISTQLVTSNKEDFLLAEIPDFSQDINEIIDNFGKK